MRAYTSSRLSEKDQQLVITLAKRVIVDSSSSPIDIYSARQVLRSHGVDGWMDEQERPAELQQLRTIVADPNANPIEAHAARERLQELGAMQPASQPNSHLSPSGQATHDQDDRPAFLRVTPLGDRAPGYAFPRMKLSDAAPAPAHTQVSWGTVILGVIAFVLIYGVYANLDPFGGFAKDRERTEQMQDQIARNSAAEAYREAIAHGARDHEAMLEARRAYARSRAATK